MTRHRTAVIATATLSTLGLITLAGAGVLRAPSGEGAQPTQQPGQPAQGGPNFGEILLKGLKESKGCLKVITADTSEGTNTIIAWFENKQAAVDWYYSPTHKRFMEMAGSSSDTKRPLAHVKDEKAPVMVMASIKFGGEKVLPGPMPISQISIELYTPLDAGASVNGRLMPDEIKLEHFNSIDAAYSTDD